MSKYGIAHHHASIYPNMVPLLAHHQMLCDCSLAKPDSRTKKQTRNWLCKTVVTACVD